MWPTDPESLGSAQVRLADAAPPPTWRPGRQAPRVAGLWVCFPRGLTGPGGGGDPVWVAAVVTCAGRLLEHRVDTGSAAAPYVPGLLALRLGPVMEQTVRRLGTRPDVLLLDATARDHPRRAGLALHLGAELDLPTVGITHRPLRGRGEWPADVRGATSPVRDGDTVVGCWLRTQPGVRPLVVHPGWRVDLATAVDLLVAAAPQRRTPEPLRRARRLAREARAADTGGSATSGSR